MTSPEWSTATQNEAVGHETEASIVGAVCVGARPGAVAPFEYPSRTIHSYTERSVGHETLVGATPMVVVGAGPGSIRTGADQPNPLQ